jgi:hypothetical protein
MNRLRYSSGLPKMPAEGVLKHIKVGICGKVADIA